MTVVNNTKSAAQPIASVQTSSIILLSIAVALVRAALVIAGAVSLGATARYFFPEMFAIPNNAVTLLAVVGIDTFALVAGLLLVRNKSMSKAG